VVLVLLSPGVMWRNAKALVCLMAFDSVWATVEVTKVNASQFDPTEYDVVFDVRNSDEYAGEGGDCSIGSADSLGAPHLPGAVWSPELYHCGARGPTNFTCTTLLQEFADVAFLGTEGSLQACTPLHVAFICHSGVRSLASAQSYAKLMETFHLDVPSPVSVAGGTRGWYQLGRTTEFGAPTDAEELRTCAQLVTVV